MKNRILFPFALILLLTAGLNTAFGQASGKTSLKGNLRNQQREYFIIRQQGRADTVKLGKEGSFELLIEQNTGNYFTLEHVKQAVTIYLLPGDEANITLNAANLLDATVTGKSTPYCNYLIQKQKADKNDQALFPGYKTGALRGEVVFAIRDSIRNARIELLNKSATAGSFVTPFTETESKLAGYQMGYELIAYKTQATKMGTTVFPATFEKFLNSLDLNDEQVTYDSYFKSFALNRLASKATEMYYAGTIKTTLHFYELEIDAICDNVTSQKNKSVLISEFMPQLIKDVGTSDLRSIIAKLETCCSDQKLINSVKKFAAQYEYLYPGKPSPDAVFYDASGAISKISTYKGKVLYIDAWATWCGPCKREIPHLKTLEEEYHGKNVQFISVSTDKDVNAWKAFIAKEKMAGLQLHQSDTFEETISKLFVVNSIPRFIIIDEAGNIVSSDAPRPSSGEEIRSVLNQLLAD